MSQRNKILIAIILVGIGVTARLLPHWWNFTPIIAISLFAGVYLGRNYVWVLPVITMFLSDIFIGFYDLKLMFFVYGSFVIVGIFSYLIKEKKNIITIFLATISASVLFYFITNWAVWQFGLWYPKTINGLLNSYTLAIPFFRNALLGDLFYTFSFFGAYELAIFFVKNFKFAKIFNLKFKEQM